MTQPTNNEFQEITNRLSLLQNVKADPAFRSKMKQKIAALSPASRFAMQFFALRIAVLVFLVLVSGSGMVAASSQSKPGEILYPVKQMVESVGVPYKPIHKQQIPRQNATTVPTKEPTPLPTVPLAPKKQYEEPVTNTVQEATPTPTPSTSSGPTATPTPAQQTVLPATENAVDEVLESLPVDLPIGGPAEPSPTPQSKGHSDNGKSKKEGSKDNGSDVGAGGSLLPKLKNKLTSKTDPS